ncbi:MAG: DUF4091 domain-containing protein [Isosphaeraceae bacterium]|nr:DUF4091 domain-containing protein [Isosphaeraceae bacterium]
MKTSFAAVLAALLTVPCSCGGETLRVPVTRDLWVSNVGSEADGSNGGAPRLKLKSIQEMSLVDIDSTPLRGRVVKAAALHVRSTGEPRLRRVTVGSVGAEWVEGTGSGYQPQPGSSSFNNRQNPDIPWAEPGSDLCSVILGAGGTLWRMADATEPDRQGWQQVPVAPEVVAARVAGVGHGFLLFDDTGTEWTRAGDRFTVHHMPNRFVYSREQNAASAPYFTVELGAEDRTGPDAPTGLTAEPADLPAGEAWLSWTTPADRGEGGTIGFFVVLDGKDLPRYAVPLAGRPGEVVRMHLRDQRLAAGAQVELSVRAVDRAGNMGVAAVTTVRVSDRAPRALPGEPVRPFSSAGPLPKLAGADVAVIDELDKVQPLSGTFIPPRPASYLGANHLWDASARRIRLHAARNEFVGFQVLIRGGATEVRPALAFPSAPRVAVEFGRYWPVATKRGALPDPIVPLSVPRGKDETGSQSLYGEVYVPHDAPAGAHRGRLTLRAGTASLELEVALEVWDFTLPDVLSFLPEMNCYDLPANERDYYRLAHVHRTFLNRVPYHHSGAVSAGCAPGVAGASFDFSEWDRRFGPYFDGSAFADLPRKGVPIDGFYLPLFENWPSPMEPNYNGDYWADRAFPERYRAAFVDAAGQFAAHFHQKGWNDTLFQCYFNGKHNFKERGWLRGTCPWLLDEPANFQDFWALRYFGQAFHEGVKQAGGRAKLVFRADISRPQWQRDALDGLLDYNVVGGAFRRYRRLVLDRKSAQGQVVIEYGSANGVEDSNVQPAAWALDAWALGADGVLPWQTVGDADSWRQGDALSLFYPGRDGGAPLPSIRLKSFRRGQQDVEYLTLLAQVQQAPRWAVADGVRSALRLVGERSGTGAAGEDAGVIRFDALRPEDLWALRIRVGQALSKARPRPQRRLVELRTPRSDTASIPLGR